MTPVTDIELIPKAEILFAPGYRMRGLKGGRGSGKSWAAARALLMRGMQQPERILSCREFMNSIADSNHKLFADQIFELGLNGFYNVQKTAIYGANGTEILFAGLKTNPQSVKSKERITIAHLEEASTISQTSWDLLMPTIRTPGSEIWAVWNPESEKDPVNQIFCVNPPPRTIVEHVTFEDNPWFTAENEEQRLHCLATNPTDYDWIWKGDFRKISDACIFKGKFTVEEFDIPERTTLYFGADFGHGIDGDPCTLVACFIQNDCLYISHEVYVHEAELDDLPAHYDTIPGSRKWTIRGDSSRPETINHLKRKGFNIIASDKWGGSVDDGIAHLKSYRKIIIHSRCKHMAEEARKYSWKTDPKTGEIFPIPVDADNHLWDGVRYALCPLIRQDGTSLESWARLARRR